MQNIAVFGATGALGQAFCLELASRYPTASVHAIARQISHFDFANIYPHALDFDNELALESLFATLTQQQLLDCVIVAIGVLHQDNQLSPEKSLRNLNAEQLHQLFHTNTVLPMMIAKHALPVLNPKTQPIFAVLSARIGSISDNRLGGWYGYRMAKASLNMGIKNLSIEAKCKYPNTIIVALHPGTVDSNLSKPFQKNVPKEKLFDPIFSVQSLIHVLNALTPNDTGKIWAWDGQEILP